LQFLIAPNTHMFSSLWTTHWATNGSISKFHFEAFAHHTLSSMLSNKIYETYCVRILSCFNFGANIWFTIRPTFLAFQLSFSSCFTMLRMQLGLTHLSIVGIFRCVCTHPINAAGVHLYITPMVTNTHAPMM
jgi:hypothetical protein